MSLISNILAPIATPPQSRTTSQSVAMEPAAAPSPAPEAQSTPKQDQSPGQQSFSESNAPAGRPQVSTATFEAIVLPQNPPPARQAPASGDLDSARQQAIQSLAAMRVEDMVSDLGKAPATNAMLALDGDAGVERVRDEQRSTATASAREVQAAYAENLGESIPAQKESAFA